MKNSLKKIIVSGIILFSFFLFHNSAFAASRFWVGGTGNWDASTTTHWSASSGGAGGQSVPTSSDNVIFDSLSNASTYAVTVTATANCNNIDFTNSASGTLVFTGSSALNVFGNFTIHSAMTYSYTGTITFSSTSTGNTITSNGISLLGPVIFDGVGGGWTLQDNFSSTNTLNLTNGIFNSGTKNITAATFNSNNSNIRTATLTNSNITFTGAGSTWRFDTATNLSYDFSGSTFTFNNVATIFGGGGLTYNNVSMPGTSGSTTIVLGANTFNQFQFTPVSGGSTIRFVAGTTNTFASFLVSGTAGNVVTITSDNGAGSPSTSTHTLTKTGGGVISSDYLNIQHSIATPSSTWYAGVNSTNNQGVATAGSGWIFSAPATSIKSFLGLLYANTKTILGLSEANMKTFNGLQ